MIKAVFLDFYNTLISFVPPRDELQAAACREFGIEINRKAIPRGYWLADDFMSRENARSPVHRRSPSEEMAFWSDYESIILKTAGVEVTKESALQIFTRARRLDRRFILFDDVLPILGVLKGRGIVMGIVSNLSHTLDGHLNELGLTSYVDFALTSFEIGAEKPHPSIFLTALERAGVGASEAIHVGDQYNSDIVGARGVGINPLLLDRDGFWEGINDCPRIRSLSEITDYL